MSPTSLRTLKNNGSVSIETGTKEQPTTLQPRITDWKDCRAAILGMEAIVTVGKNFKAEVKKVHCANEKSYIVDLTLTHHLDCTNIGDILVQEERTIY